MIRATFGSVERLWPSRGWVSAPRNDAACHRASGRRVVCKAPASASRRNLSAGDFAAPLTHRWSCATVTVCFTTGSRISISNRVAGPGFSSTQPASATLLRPGRLLRRGRRRRTKRCGGGFRASPAPRSRGPSDPPSPRGGSRGSARGPAPGRGWRSRSTAAGGDRVQLVVNCELPPQAIEGLGILGGEEGRRGGELEPRVLHGRIMGHLGQSPGPETQQRPRSPLAFYCSSTAYQWLPAAVSSCQQWETLRVFPRKWSGR